MSLVHAEAGVGRHLPALDRLSEHRGKCRYHFVGEPGPLFLDAAVAEIVQLRRGDQVKRAVEAGLQPIERLVVVIAGRVREFSVVRAVGLEPVDQGAERAVGVDAVELMLARGVVDRHYIDLAQALDQSLAVTVEIRDERAPGPTHIDVVPAGLVAGDLKPLKLHSNHHGNSPPFGAFRQWEMVAYRREHWKRDQPVYPNATATLLDRQPTLRCRYDASRCGAARSGCAGEIICELPCACAWGRVSE